MQYEANKQRTICFVKLLLICVHIAHCLDAKITPLSQLSSRLQALSRKYKPTIKYTQTQAWLTISSLKQDVEDCYASGPGFCWKYPGLKNIIKLNPVIKKIVNTALTREKTYKNSHYVFYHGHHIQLQLLEDFVTYMCQLEGGCKAKDPFVLLRYFGDKNKHIYIDGKPYSFYNLPNLVTWMTKEKQKAKAAGLWHDFNNIRTVQPFLFSVNLSLYGNIDNPSSHTFHYFLSGVSANPPPLSNLLTEAISKYIKDKKKRKKFVKRLIKLTKPSITGATLAGSVQHGNLIQIFIPHTLVDKVVYLCRPYGLYWKSYIDKTDTHKFFKNNLGYTSIASILKIYQNDPKRFNNSPSKHGMFGQKLLDAFQARILLKGEFFSRYNPKNDIKIFRYSAIKPSVQKAYYAQLKKIANEIFAAKDT